MKKQKIIMKISVTIAFSFLLILLPVYATHQSGIAHHDYGLIYQLDYSPKDVFVLEDVTFSIGVENPSNITRNYLLSIQVVKGGKIIHQQEFTFTLEKAKRILFSPEFTPQNIGEFEIIARLYDKFKINIYDIEIIKFNSMSILGPFDIIVTPLTERIRPGLNLPVEIVLENMGTKETDVEVKVEINCPDKIITQTFTAFVSANKRIQKLVRMPVCEQEGLYNILASILLLNQTWVSSMSQFFVNSTAIELSFDVPDEIQLRAGQTISFPIEVTNLGNHEIHNMKFIIQGIPLNWQESHPSSISEVHPGETVVFIINITTPYDAETTSYEIRMTATADEVLERKLSTLKLSSFVVLPLSPVTQEINPLFRYIPISVSVVILVVGGALIVFINRKTLLKSLISKQPTVSHERIRILKKIREKIKSKD